MSGKVFLIPSFLHEDSPIKGLANLIDPVDQCKAFFVENERTARRFVKKLSPTFNIDMHTWYPINKEESSLKESFRSHLLNNETIGIISEAGCPCVADPGQLLVAIAHQIGAEVIPLVGPNAILLSLMASGLNGQKFKFNGYLPIEASERKKSILTLEKESASTNCTQIFIETPYRNNQMIADIIQSCSSDTKLCIAVDITAPTQLIKTKNIAEWKKSPPPDIHKRPAVFLLYKLS